MALSHRLSLFFTNLLVRGGYIDSDDRANYVYCYDYIIENIFFFAVITILSFVINAPVFGITFYVTIMIFRSTCGGYHAKTRTQCSIMSLGMFFITYCVNLIMPAVITNDIIWLVIFLICSLLLYCNLPIISIRTFNEEKTSAMLLKKRLSVLLYSAVFVLFYFIFHNPYYIILTICILFAAINMLAGQLLCKKGGIR